MSRVLVLAVVAALVCLVVARVSHLDAEWASFKLTHRKVYASQAEHDFRKTVFASNLDLVRRLQLNDRSAEYGVTKFSDLTPNEFRQMYLMEPIFAGDAKNSCLAHGVIAPKMSVRDTPTSIDWRQKGAVTPVKDQGQCGSCWTFSTTGNIEGQWFLAGNPLVSLSEQQIVDCDGTCSDVGDPPQVVCDAGCQGGWPWAAMFGVMNIGGIMSETSYPYTAMDGTCQFSASKVAVKIANYTCLPTDETQIAAYVAQNGPVSIALNADKLQFYKKGTLDPISCESKQLDHAVLIVGYDNGSSSDKPYWIVKNSWGTDWGMDGYFQIVMGKGKCGINNAVSSALIHQ